MSIVRVNKDVSFLEKTREMAIVRVRKDVTLRGKLGKKL